jgi:UDP-N-acetylmuramyl pentapeptide synthase
VPESVAQGPHELKLPERRLQSFEVDGIRILDDSYNANPASMRLGLDTLIAESKDGRRVAVLGTMAELGDRSADYHSEIGRYARSRADFVIGVGEPARHYVPDVLFADSEACATAIDGLLKRGDQVLVKGSASVGMNKIVDRIKSRSADLPVNPADQTGGTGKR